MKYVCLYKEYSLLFFKGNGEHHHREEYGDITFEIKFRTALPDTIQILVRLCVFYSFSLITVTNFQILLQVYFGYSGGISINKEQQVILMPVWKNARIKGN